MWGSCDHFSGSRLCIYSIDIHTSHGFINKGSKTAIIDKMIGFVKVLSVLATIAVAFGFRHQALKSCRQRGTVLSMSKRKIVSSELKTETFF